MGNGRLTGSNDDESLESLERAVELGCNFFDTAAWAYGQDAASARLGQLLRAKPDAESAPPRSRPQSQWARRARRHARFVSGRPHPRVRREEPRQHRVSTLDLLQFHSWNDAWAEDGEWQRCGRRVEVGEARARRGYQHQPLGTGQCPRALRTGLIDAVQVVQRLRSGAGGRAVSRVPRARWRRVIARVPFDEGTLTGTLTNNTTWPEGDFRNIYFAGDKARRASRAERLRPDVPAGMTMPELALRFILAHPDVSTVIPGMRKRAHVDANLGASDGRARCAAAGYSAPQRAPLGSYTPLRGEASKRALRAVASPGA